MVIYGLILLGCVFEDTIILEGWGPAGVIGNSHFNGAFTPQLTTLEIQDISTTALNANPNITFSRGEGLFKKKMYQMLF